LRARPFIGITLEHEPQTRSERKNASTHSMQYLAPPRTLGSGSRPHAWQVTNFSGGRAAAAMRPPPRRPRIFSPLRPAVAPIN